MKPTLEDLRLRSGLTAAELQRQANISHSTWRLMAKKLQPVSATMVSRVLTVLNARLGTAYSLDDVDCLIVMR